MRTFTRSFMRVHPESEVAALADVRVMCGARSTLDRRTVRAVASIHFAEAIKGTQTTHRTFTCASM